METEVKDISDSLDKKATLKGWLYNKRSSGGIIFLEIRDGTGFIQAVVSKNEVDQKTWETAQRITQESSIEITGKVTEHAKKEDEYELQVKEMEIIQLVEEKYPIDLKEHGPDFLLRNRHLWLRDPKQWAVLKIRDTVIRAIREYLHKEGFTLTDSPVFTPNACEDTTELFEVDYLDEETAYLTQSGQLYLEAAIMSTRRAYDFGPVFRAEKSTTKRHLTEFWMMDAEAAFVHHQGNMDIQEKNIKYIIEKCLDECGRAFEILDRDTSKLQEVVDNDFIRLTYEETIKKLQDLGSDIEYGEDFGNADEAMLTKDSKVPIFIERWPKELKPFYMKLDEDDEDFVLNNDLIATEEGGEIVGGSEREDNYDKLLSRIEAEGLNKENYDWYLDLRKYGSVPHSGYGIGVERVVRWITGVEHVRETIPFPRLVNRIRP